jgi:hypothetical protein
VRRAPEKPAEPSLGLDDEGGVRRHTGKNKNKSRQLSLTADN